MIYRLLADALVVVHVAFVLFAVFGGLLVLRWPRAALVHLPAAAWAVVIEFAGWICPLTPLEVRWRVLGGEAGYEGGFVERYLLPVIYPEGLERSDQLVLGAAVLLLNAGIYGAWLLRTRSRAARERRDAERTR